MAYRNTAVKTSACLLIGAGLLMPTTLMAAKPDPGRALSLEFCQACHFYEGTNQAGNVAPPLVGMKGRFPDRKRLYQIIHDPIKVLGRDTMMPPFGRNGLMNETQINTLIDFLYTL